MHLFALVMRVLYVRLLRESKMYILSDSCGLFWVTKCFIGPVVQEATYILYLIIVVTIPNGRLRQKTKVN